MLVWDSTVCFFLLLKLHAAYAIVITTFLSLPPPILVVKSLVTFWGSGQESKLDLTQDRQSDERLGV